MSVLVPYHRMIFPASSRNGSTRMRNQRKTPSCRRSRASISPDSPETNSCRHFSIKGERSSGWNAACQPQPFDSSGWRPVYSCHRLLRNSFAPSARLHQASVGIVSITWRSLTSDSCTCSSALGPFSKSFATDLDSRMRREARPRWMLATAIGT